MNTNNLIDDKINNIKCILDNIDRRCWGRNTKEYIEKDINLLTSKARLELELLETLCLKSKN